MPTTSLSWLMLVILDVNLMVVYTIIHIIVTWTKLLKTTC
jgi:hypothetical protein